MKKRILALMLAMVLVLGAMQINNSASAEETNLEYRFQQGEIIVTNSIGSSAMITYGRADRDYSNVSFTISTNTKITTSASCAVYKYDNSDPSNLVWTQWYSEIPQTYIGYKLWYVSDYKANVRDSWRYAYMAFLAPVNADVASGSYTSNQTVTLTNAENDEMYYTLDSTDPSKTNGTKYTGPISVEGVAGETKTVTLKAVSVHTYNGVDYTGDIATYTYTIELPPTSYAVTVTDGTGSESYQVGDTVTITANDKPGYVFKKWEVVSGGASLADATKKTTTFTMPASAVSVKALYEIMPPEGGYDYDIKLENSNTVTGLADGGSFIAGDKFGPAELYLTGSNKKYKVSTGSVNVKVYINGADTYIDLDGKKAAVRVYKDSVLEVVPSVIGGTINSSSFSVLTGGTVENVTVNASDGIAAGVGGTIYSGIFNTSFLGFNDGNVEGGTFTVTGNAEFEASNISGGNFDINGNLDIYGNIGEISGAEIKVGGTVTNGIVSRGGERALNMEDVTLSADGKFTNYGEISGDSYITANGGLENSGTIEVEYLALDGTLEGTGEIKTTFFEGDYASYSDKVDTIFTVDSTTKTYVLQKDVMLEGFDDFAADSTLDLNGHTLTVSDDTFAFGNIVGDGVIEGDLVVITGDVSGFTGTWDVNMTYDESTSTYKLMKDIELADDFTVAAGEKLDLNGHTLTVPSGISLDIDADAEVAGTTTKIVYADNKIKATGNDKFEIAGKGDIITAGSSFAVVLLSSGDVYTKAVELIKKNEEIGDKFVVFDFNLKDKNGVEVHELGDYVEVSMPVPEGYAADKIVVYRVDGNKLTELETKVESGKLIIKTNHFSTYIIAEKEKKTPETNPKTGDPFDARVWMLLVLSGMGLVGLRLKKREN